MTGSDAAKDASVTRHTVNGEIAGNDVELVVEGPEAQDLDEDDDRVGSDIITLKIQRRMAALAEVHGGETPDG